MNRRFDTKIIVWLLLLVGVLTVTSLLLLTIFGFGEFTDELQQPSSEADDNIEHEHLIQHNHNEQIRILKQEIRALKLKVLQLEQQCKSTPSSLNASQLHEISSSPASALQFSSSSVHFYDCASYIRKQVGNAEILHGLPFNNEYELIPFNHFTFTRVYPIELGLGKRVVEKPIGRKRKDLLDALVKALDSLNKNTTLKSKTLREKTKFTLDDFIEGVYRTEPTTGTQYELYFQKQMSGNSASSKLRSLAEVRRVIVIRPFAPLQTVQMTTPYEPKQEIEMIQIVLPLAGRLVQFRIFLKNFIEMYMTKDRNIRLTVVYFGETGLDEAKRLVGNVQQQFRKEHNFVKLFAVNETFSRAKGLRIGAERSWFTNSTRQEALLFMCDVDVVFNEKFLNRCRWNAEPGKKVYYPVVFSLYNPHVVYTLQGRDLPTEAEQLQITRDTGFWRDFGYGMTCQYKSDFLEVRGFDEEIVGWGGEDVMLYRKYVRSKIKIIRATDPGIYHKWHPKVCTGVNSRQNLTDDQYRACIRSRALNEASHAQLGFLAFRDEIAQNINSKATNQ